jgi:hypothetical protein
VIKLLFVVLVLSTIAVLGVAGVIYWRVRKHLATPTPPTAKPDGAEEGEQATSEEEQHR